MDTKKLIENIIEDLVNDVPISKIMLKAQAIAFALKNEEFSKWVYQEQNGYKDPKRIPDYRKVGSALVVNASFPLGRIVNNYHIPIDILPNPVAKEYFTRARILQSITAIEDLCNTSEGKQIYLEVPGVLWRDIEASLVEGNVLAAKQVLSLSTLKAVVENLKSQLLQFFLELGSNVDIDFNVLANGDAINKIMNQTINAGVYNIGDVSLTNSTVVGGQGNCVTIAPKLRNEIEDVLRKVEALRRDVEADEQDIAEVVMDIRAELEKESPSKKWLKRGLQALKSFHAVVVEKAIEYGIDQILMQLG